MSLGDVLQGPFFMEYIKKGKHYPTYIPPSADSCVQGNVLMLSEGRTGVDNVFSLKDGTLQRSHWWATHVDVIPRPIDHVSGEGDV